MTRYGTLILAAQLSVCFSASAQDHLEPEDGVLNQPEWHWDYAKRLREVLLKDAATHHLARMVCLPSFEPEWVVSVIREEGQDFDAPHTYYVEYVGAQERLFHAKDARSLTANRSRTSLDRETAESLNRVWRRMLRTPRFPMEPTEPDIAFVAALIGEPARAAICLALMDDRARPASELARAARVSAQTASNHLAKLTAGGLFQVERQGRWRYYRLTNEEIAHAVEALAAITPRNIPVSPHRNDDGPKGLFAARTCYRHLAGKLGVELADALCRDGWVARGGTEFQITPEGVCLLVGLGIDLPALRRRSRTVARRCIDWSERRPHIAGPLGTALADLAFARDWIRRQRWTRAVLITPLGRSELERNFRAKLH